MKDLILTARAPIFSPSCENKKPSERSARVREDLTAPRRHGVIVSIHDLRRSKFFRQRERRVEYANCAGSAAF
jgi:hypothetical protein